MKLFRVIVGLLLCYQTQAQTDFININQFTINGNTYKVRYEPNIWLYITNIADNMKQTPGERDCAWWENSPVDIIASNRKVEMLVVNMLPVSRKQAFEAKNEHLEMGIRIDGSRKIKEIIFSLSPQTILTRDEIYQIEQTLKNKEVIMDSKYPCNFNWLYFDTKIKLW
jgi:hypothetical protein